MKTAKAPAMVPVIRLVAPTAAMATGLLSPVAWSASGDLDPNFGDLGRVRDLPDLTGPAWSAEAGDEDTTVFAGSDERCDYDFYYYTYDNCDLSGFTGRLDADGGLDAEFAVRQLDGTDVRDMVLQPDGKAVAAGRTRVDGRYRLTLFRLNRDGGLDPTFGNQGIVLLDAAMAEDVRATSLALEPGGGITVAGLRGNELLVARFSADGVLDPGFGSNGVLAGPSVDANASLPRIVRVASGGYRVTTHPVASQEGASALVRCRVLAVTESGAIDTSFGTGGMSGPLTPAATWDECSSLAAVSADRVLVAGSVGGESEAGFVTRLRADGSVDDAFAGNAVAATLRRVTALGVAGDGRATLAGHDPAGLSGAVVVRLQADGTLDTLFGRGGSTALDLPSEFDAWPTVHDITIGADGSSILAGGEYGTRPFRPFLARLQGDGSAAGPGILDVANSSIAVAEADGTAVVTVRRIGGSSGAVSVAYSTGPSSIGGAALPGADFTAVAGVLNWADGDGGERQISIPIAADDGTFEFTEYFALNLTDASGGAGLGSRSATVTVIGDGVPHGYFSLSLEGVAGEFGPPPAVVVRRNEHADGQVSVMLTAIDGNATNGTDYRFDGPVTLTWADGDYEPKRVPLVILDDKKRERMESFTLKLSGATGGARIGPADSITVNISDDDDGGGSGGGVGGSGPLALLLAAMAALRRRCRGAR